MRTREELIEECKRIAGLVADTTERALTTSRPAGWTCASCRRFVSSSEAIGDCLARCPQCSLANAVTKDGYVMGRVWPERIWPAPELPDSTVQNLMAAGVYPVVEGEVRLTPYEECRKIVRQWHGLADGPSQKLAAFEQLNADFEAGRVKISPGRDATVLEMAQLGILSFDEARDLLGMPRTPDGCAQDAVREQEAQRFAWLCASCETGSGSTDPVGDALGRCQRCSTENKPTRHGYVMGMFKPERASIDRPSEFFSIGDYVRWQCGTRWHEGVIDEVHGDGEVTIVCQIGCAEIYPYRMTFMAKNCRRVPQAGVTAPSSQLSPYASVAEIRNHIKGLGWDVAWSDESTEPLDVKYDDVTLRELLFYDEQRRKELASNYKPHTFTPAQRATVSAYWSAELRARGAAAKAKERERVVLDVDPEDL